jgi:hypothetical protein
MHTIRPFVGNINLPAAEISYDSHHKNINFWILGNSEKANKSKVMFQKDYLKKKLPSKSGGN